MMPKVSMLAPARAYRFFFGEEQPLIAGTGGPGLGWRFALNDALRERGRRRGKQGWRALRYTRIVELTVGVDGRRDHFIAHAAVTTTRGEVLDVWVQEATATIGARTRNDRDLARDH